MSCVSSTRNAQIDSKVALVALLTFTIVNPPFSLSLCNVEFHLRDELESDFLRVFFILLLSTVHTRTEALSSACIAPEQARVACSVEAVASCFFPATTASLSSKAKHVTRSAIESTMPSKRDDDYVIDLADGEEHELEQLNGDHKPRSPRGAHQHQQQTGGSALAALANNPTASILGYCLASISMTVVNKFVVSGSDWNLMFLYLAIQVCCLWLRVWFRSGCTVPFAEMQKAIKSKANFA